MIQSQPALKGWTYRHTHFEKAAALGALLMVVHSRRAPLRSRAERNSVTRSGVGRPLRPSVQ